jgi:hypothetical protein
MNLRKFAFTLLGLSAFFLCFCLVNDANAVSISPLTFELIANPGETISSVISISNDQVVPAGVTIEIEDFIPVGEEGQVALEENSENTTYSLSKWVTTNPQTFVLGPGETKPVEFTINVPLNAEPGGHYGSVLANISGAAPQGGGVGVAQKVGSLLLLNVTGEIKESLRIIEFSAPNFSEYGPISILSRFENTGSVHLKPGGFIIVKNSFGREIAKLDLPQKNVLPNSIRRIETSLAEKNLFGKYEATLTSIYGSRNEPLVATTVFWVIPWKVALTVTIGALVLLCLLIRGRKRIKLALKILFRGHHTSI